jgi:hypothetical protein
MEICLLKFALLLFIALIIIGITLLLKLMNSLMIVIRKNMGPRHTFFDDFTVPYNTIKKYLLGYSLLLIVLVTLIHQFLIK